MLVTTTWQQITTGTGVLIQKNGAQGVSLSYHTTTPTNQPNFGVTVPEAQVFPAIAGKNIYVRTQSGTSNISIEAL